MNKIAERCLTRDQPAQTPDGATLTETMDRIKNPDVAAILTMLLALLAEVVARMAADASLLAMLPPWFGPVALAVAASLRLRLGQASTATGAVPAPPTNPEPQ